jgi:SAM-dependent methyltransferase
VTESTAAVALTDSQHQGIKSSMDTEIRIRKELEQRVYWDVVGRRPDSLFQMFLKMLQEPRYLQSVVRKHMRFGRPKPLPVLTTDRLVLEQQIFTHFQSKPDVRNILFVGCDADTAGYHNGYFKNARFVTLEPNPDNRHFGAPEHVIDSLEHLDRHFSAESFDLVLCNGVFGWGLDAFDNCQTAFEQTYRVLRRGGTLMLGWNDVPPRVPFPLESIPSLAQFKKSDFPPFGTWRYLTDTVYRHTYDFYCK